MFDYMGKVLSLSAAAWMVTTAISSAQSQNLAELEAAAKQEAMLTTIALPPDWCGYGAVFDGFMKK